MGGMIAQLVATHYPLRTRSLSSLMSTSGNPGLPRPAPAVISRIMMRPADDPHSLLTHGIESPATYVYRGIVADCLRAAEFLVSRPEVDQSRIGLNGDDLVFRR